MFRCIVVFLRTTAGFTLQNLELNGSIDFRQELVQTEFFSQINSFRGKLRFWEFFKLLLSPLDVTFYQQLIMLG